MIRQPVTIVRHGSRCIVFVQDEEAADRIIQARARVVVSVNAACRRTERGDSCHGSVGRIRQEIFCEGNGVGGGVVGKHKFRAVRLNGAERAFGNGECAACAFLIGSDGEQRGKFVFGVAVFPVDVIDGVAGAARLERESRRRRLILNDTNRTTDVSETCLCRAVRIDAAAQRCEDARSNCIFVRVERINRPEGVGTAEGNLRVRRKRQLVIALGNRKSRVRTTTLQSTEEFARVIDYNCVERAVSGNGNDCVEVRQEGGVGGGPEVNAVTVRCTERERERIRTHRVERHCVGDGVVGAVARYNDAVCVRARAVEDISSVFIRGNAAVVVV